MTWIAGLCVGLKGLCQCIAESLGSLAKIEWNFGLYCLWRLVGYLSTWFPVLLGIVGCARQAFCLQKASILQTLGAQSKPKTRKIARYPATSLLACDISEWKVPDFANLGF